MFIDDHVFVWHAAAKLSSGRHILWFDKPFHWLLSSAPLIYDKLWTVRGLTHFTHLHGDGRYEKGQEHARVKVTLSSQIFEEDCELLSLGYLNPADVKIQEWENRETEGVIFVLKAGEMIYRVR